jgi:DNA-binding transcriptional ArsR family regulator
MNRYSIVRKKGVATLALRVGEDAAEIADVFRLLGDPTRLRVVAACLEGMRAVSEIADEIAATPSLVSHHLRLLRAARLVRAERHGKNVFYAVADDHVRCILVDIIDHVREPKGEDV